MATTVKSNSLKINIMPNDVYVHYSNSELINDNELYLVEDDSLLLTNTGTVVSQFADYSEVAEWPDGNLEHENRVGYFVSVDVCATGISMQKATSTSDIRGVTMLNPGFAANASPDKFDIDGKLLPKYNYVAFVGFVPVIDYGRCTVRGKCISDDNGTAIPSPNDMGYQVIDRIDEDHILILVEPQADALARIKDEMNTINSILNNKQDIVDYITDEDIDAMFEGTYIINKG